MIALITKKMNYSPLAVARAQQNLQGSPAGLYPRADPVELTASRLSMANTKYLKNFLKVMSLVVVHDERMER